MLDLISRAGEHPPALRLLGADGSRLPNIEATRWQDGHIEIVSLFRQSGNRETATVVLPEVRRVFDLRTGEYLGRASEFQAEIIPCRASFLALTNVPVATPDFQVGPRFAARGTVATASISVPAAEGLQGR